MAGKIENDERKYIPLREQNLRTAEVKKRRPCLMNGCKKSVYGFAGDRICKSCKSRQGNSRIEYFETSRTFY